MMYLLTNTHFPGNFFYDQSYCYLADYGHGVSKVCCKCSEEKGAAHEKFWIFVVPKTSVFGNKFLADSGKARGCSTITSVINSLGH